LAISLWEIPEKPTSLPQEPTILLHGGHDRHINCVDWSRASSNFIASIGDDHRLIIWDRNREDE
jgi:WD40 repeat protein